MPRTLAILLGILLALAPTVPAAAAEPEVPLARHLPADTLAAIAVDDLAAIEGALARTRVASLFREPDVAAIVDEVAATVAPDIARAEATLGFKLRELAGLARGSAIYGITDLGLPAENPALRYQLLILRPDDDAALALWGRIQARLAETGVARPPGSVAGEMEMNGATVHTLRAGDVASYLAHFRGHVVYGTDAVAVGRAIKSIAAGSAAPEEGSLAARAEYRAVREACLGGQPGALLYVDVAGIRGKMLVKAAEAASGVAGGGDKGGLKVLDALGLADVRAGGLGAALDGRGFRDTLYLHAPDARAGLFALAGPDPSVDAARALARVPADAFLAVSVPGSLARAYVLYLALAQQIAPPGDYGKIKGALDTFRSETGIALRDLLLPFAGDIVLYATLPERGEGLYPEVVLLADLRDPAALRAHLDALVARLTRAGSDRPALDIRTIPLPAAGPGSPGTFHYVNLGRLAGAQVIEPALAIRGSTLVVAATPMHLKRTMERLAATDVPGLVHGPAWSDAARDLEPGARLVVYADLPKVLAGLYNTYGPFFQSALDKGDLPFDPGLLPTGTTLSRHLYGATLALYREPRGVRLVLRSPVGPWAVVAAGAATDTIKKLAAKAPPGMAGPSAAAPRVTFDFKEMELAAALEAVAAQGRAQVFFPRARCEGRRVTVAGTDQPLEAAIERLLEGTGLAVRVRRLPGDEIQVTVYEAAAAPEGEGEKP